MSENFDTEQIIEFIIQERKSSDGGRQTEIDDENQLNQAGTSTEKSTTVTKCVKTDSNQEIFLKSFNKPSTTTAETINNSFINFPTNHPSGYLSSEEQSSRFCDIMKEHDTICRICYEVEKNELFLSPCNCKGTISSVHRECLERWLAERDTDRCEICGFSYTTIRVPKYGMLKAFYIWLTSEETVRDRREVFIDVIGMTLFAPIATTGTYVGLILADAMEGIPPFEDENVNVNQMLITTPGRMTLLTLVSLLITFDVAYATWIGMRIQNHFYNWCAWYRRNSKVTVLPNAVTQED